MNTRRTLGLAALSGLALTAAPAARAAQSEDPAAGAGTAVMATLHSTTAGLGATQLYPLAHTPLDVLSNNLHVPVAGMNLSTLPVTAPLHDGLPLREVPVAGRPLR